MICPSSFLFHQSAKVIMQWSLLNLAVFNNFIYATHLCHLLFIPHPATHVLHLREGNSISSVNLEALDFLWFWKYCRSGWVSAFYSYVPQVPSWVWVSMWDIPFKTDCKKLTSWFIGQIPLTKVVNLVIHLQIPRALHVHPSSISPTLERLTCSKPAFVFY